ncbi:MAG: FAD-dependent oxidoreductase [Pseudomonadota bacterium]
MSVQAASGPFAAEAEVLVVGAGACGLTAALAAHDAGAEVVVLERDAVPAGSTSLSAGLIPAAGTRWQAAEGIDDSAAALAKDILSKSKGAADNVLVEAASTAAGPALDWLADHHGLPFELVDGFVYPGHSVRRMHAMPERSGRALVDRLRAAAEAAGILIITDARAHTLLMAGKRVRGVAMSRPDGAEERVGCRALVLASNGYGGNKAYVAQHIPSLADALWFGHDGNDGTALTWGEALGADLADLSGHQGHGSVAHPHGILITWATITGGGFQVDGTGKRFSDESEGYSEQAARVLACPGGIAFTIFDSRIAEIAVQFEDFQRADAAGAILRADTAKELASRLGVPPDALEDTLCEVAALQEAGATDSFGRRWDTPPLAPPYCGVKVTGALFHTQGGLKTDGKGRVLRAGAPVPGLWAAGGAAVGVSGPTAAGYLSGNGLLTAVAMGRVAGESAASDKAD